VCIIRVLAGAGQFRLMAVSGGAVRRSKQADRKPRQPMLWAAAAFAAGIVFGTYAWRPPVWWIVAALFFSFAAAYFLSAQRFWQTFTAKALALSFLFFLGALNIQLRARPDVSAENILAYADGREVPITAHVIAEGEIKASGYGGSMQRIDVVTEEVGFPAAEKREGWGSPVHPEAGVRLNIYAKETTVEGTDPAGGAMMHAFRYGERLRCLVKLRPPHNFRNPGAFDYES